MTVVSLRDVVEALDLQSDELQSYLDPDTGEIVTFSDDEAMMAERGDWGDAPDWEKESDGTGTASDLVPNVAGRFDGNPDWTRNPSPTCQDATVTINFNGSASIPLTCIDPAPGNDPVTLSIVSSPAHGSLGSIKSELRHLHTTAELLWRGSVHVQR